MTDFSRHERALLAKLRTPARIQDFLETIPANHDETCLSPRMVLRERRAHCVEGALFAAAALRMHGFRPLIVDMESTKHDQDHVIAVFKERGFWGAISKTNHAVLRYREPIYKTLRELALSYFHEYFLNDGTKTLRTFSQPVDLSRFDSRGWMTAEEDVWYVPEYLTRIPHAKLLTAVQIRKLRKADPIERKAGMLVQWPKRKK